MANENTVNNAWDDMFPDYLSDLSSSDRIAQKAFLSDLLKYVDQEKEASRVRVRQYQQCLNERYLQAKNDPGKVRESVEKLHANAEEDFATALHLINMIRLMQKAAEEKVVLSVPPVDEGSVDQPPEDVPDRLNDQAAAAAEAKAEEEEDPDAFDPFAEEKNHDYDADQPPDDLLEEEADKQEESDSVPNLPQPHVIGRFSQMAVKDAKDAEGGVARSLPVSVPVEEPVPNDIPDQKREQENSEAEQVRNTTEH